MGSYVHIIQLGNYQNFVLPFPTMLKYFEANLRYHNVLPVNILKFIYKK